MSLINQMLRDLDARQETADETTVTDNNIGAVTNESRGWANKSRIVLVSCLMVSLLSVGYLLWQNQKDKTGIESVTSIENAGSILSDQIEVIQTAAPKTTASIPSNDTTTLVATEPDATLTLINQDDSGEQLLSREVQVSSVLEKSHINIETPSSVNTENETIDKSASQVSEQQAMVSRDTSIAKPPNETIPNVAVPNLPFVELIPEILIPERIAADTVDQLETLHSPNVQVKQVSPYSPTAEAQHSYETGLRLIEVGRLAEAEQALHRSLAIVPAHLDARRLLAMLYIQADQRSEAVSLLDQGLVTRPEHLPFITLRARLHADAGELSQAQILLEQRAISDSTGLEALELLASIYQQTTQYEKASRIYNRINQLQPDIARVWAGLAICQDALGQATSALASYRRALSLENLAPAVIIYAQQRIAILEVER